MPKIPMHYDYNAFMKELDEETAEIVAEMDDKMHRKGVSKRDQIKEELAKSIRDRNFKYKNKK